MSKLKVFSSAFVELATIENVLSAQKEEQINADNTLSFSVVLTENNTDLINDTNVIGLDGDYYDIAKYKKAQASDGWLTANVDCEHISYRLNNADYDMEYFTEIGTPSYIFGKILDGTPFSVGTVEFASVTTYSIQQAMSRRGLVVQFAELLGGELFFDGFTISILAQRGSATAKDLMAGRNIEVISKSVDKTTLDNSGNPTTSYECSLIQPMALSLGDVVTMAYATLGIDVELRIVKITSFPYNSTEINFSVSNTVPNVEDAAYKIATETVSKDALYNGCRIGPEYGFEAVRNDKLARAYFKSDGMKFQSGDGTGTTWKDRLYYEYNSELDETVLVFDGALSADVITALSAVITPNLYADKATISELTVDQLDTSVKVQNFLNEDTGDVNYIKIVGQLIQFVTAQVAGNYGATRTSSGSWDMASNQQIGTYYSSVTVDDTTGAITYSGGATVNAWDAFNAGRIYRAIDGTSYYKLTGKDALAYVYYDIYTVAQISVNYEQASNRNGSLMYWKDETHEVATTDETDYPVYIYLYNEYVKMELSFYDDGGNYVPRITLGAGTGTGDNDKLVIYKEEDKAVIKYVTDSGVEVPIELTDYVDAKMRRIDTVEIDKTGGQISVLAEGQTAAETISYSETDSSMSFTWADGHTATISIS